jgi:hypothetical protein
MAEAAVAAATADPFSSGGMMRFVPHRIGRLTIDPHGDFAMPSPDIS